MLKRTAFKRRVLLLCAVILPLTLGAEVHLSDRLIAVSVDGLDELQYQLEKTVTDVILKHLDQNTDTLDDVIECREIKEIHRVYLCMTYFQRDLNEAFTRMGMFMGSVKGIKAGTLLADDAHLLENYRKLVTGHNLPGKVVEDFYRSLATTASALNPFERMFAQGFVQHPKIQQLKGEYYVIGLSVQSTGVPLEVLSHEIPHAQYALTPGYETVVRDFWNKSLSKQDQLSIKSTLGHLYHLSENILLDEFQAYLIQSKADKGMLQAFVEPYQSALIQAFTDAGIQLVSVVSH